MPANIPPAVSNEANPAQPSAQDLAEAEKIYQSGVELEKNHKYEDALVAYKRASSLVPTERQYALAFARLTQQLVSIHMQRGNAQMAQHQKAEAAVEFQQALALDSTNQFAEQRLRDALPASKAVTSFASEEGDDELHLKPMPDRKDLHLRGPISMVLTTLAQSYGLQAEIDPAVPGKIAEINLTSVDFATALAVTLQVTHTFYVPKTDKQLFFAPDTPQKHKELDHLLLRTFDMTAFATPAEMTDIVNLVRTIFEVKSVAIAPNSSVMTVKAPQPTMQALESFFDSLQTRRPQVLLHIEAIEINHQLMRVFGVNLPSQFSIFNLPSSVLTSLVGGGNSNLQNLVNQLISGGAINQGNTSALSALLAQTLGQAQSSALLANPLMTFGGGLTLFGIGVSPGTLQASLNESRAQSLESMTLRASQGSAATFQIGERYPVINATYAPIYNSAAISKVLGNQSYIAPVPSVNYEDLGLTLKATPQVHGDSEVTLKLELSFKTLGSQSVNGVPVISNREYNGSVTLKNGETAAMVGYVTNSESRSYSGFPGIGSIPILNLATGATTKQVTDGELLIVITPFIVSPGNTGASPIYLTQGPL